MIGAPRSGFALLSSVVIHFLPLIRCERDLRQEVLNVLLRGIGNYVSQRIVQRFSDHGISRDLLYNPNFRYLVGGPKWIPRDRLDTACFRKYIGVRGRGDFTLVTSHPREVLNLDEIVHSHTDPRLWLQHPGYTDYTKFASIRNPIDILNSSVFSLNALASEYIQKFIPPEQDNDTIRQDLALYKFTDLEFFRGLARFLIGYFDEFMEVRDRYIVMRWEDLIDQPIRTILGLARQSGVSMTEDYAAGIWRKLDHVNLTQAHKHNYRVGHGVVEGWKNWITNHHISIVKEHGFDRHALALGYGEIEFLDESKYTPFQKAVSACIESGKVYSNFFDDDLFTFAFNKSNLISNKFSFKRYGWKEHTQIERSIFKDEALEEQIWACAEHACGEVNALINEYLEEPIGRSGRLERVLDRLEAKYRRSFSGVLAQRYSSIFAEARGRARSGGYMHKLWAGAGRLGARIGRKAACTAYAPVVAAELAAVPRLIAAESACNVVEYRGRFYALPHELGPVELERDEVEHRPGVFVSANSEEVLAYARNYQ